jgi:hypothetical protein
MFFVIYFQDDWNKKFVCVCVCVGVSPCRFEKGIIHQSVVLCYITYLLTPWSRVFLRSQPVNFAASQEILRIYGTQKFLTVPTSARHLPLFWANSIQSPRPSPTSWRSILILSSHLCLGLPNGLFPSGFLTNTLCTPLSFPIRATCPAHLIRLYLLCYIILHFGKPFLLLLSSW